MRADLIVSVIWWGAIAFLLVLVLVLVNR